MGRKALVLGATGLIGKEILTLLLLEARYDQVNIIVRRNIDTTHPKLNTIIANLDNMEQYGEMFNVDDVFCCLGTTMKKAKTRENFKKVDLEYPLQAARLALRYGATKFLVVSALGADQSSKFFYSRVKGELEAEIKRVPFENVVIYRPSLLIGDREEVRIGENMAAIISSLLSMLFIGPLRKYRPVKGIDVAHSMVAAALSPGKGVQMYDSGRNQVTQST